MEELAQARNAHKAALWRWSQNRADAQLLAAVRHETVHRAQFTFARNYLRRRTPV